MLNLADKVFVITTHSSQRLDYICPHLDSNCVQYEIFVAPDYKTLSSEIKIMDCRNDSRPALSLLLSYLSIFKSSILNKFQSVVIIEDDCYLADGWRDRLDRFFTSLPEDWEILHLGYHPLHNFNRVRKEINELVSIPSDAYSHSHLMMIKTQGMQEFLDMNEKFNYRLQVDYIFNEIYKREKIKAYVPNETIAHQLSTRQDSLYEIPGIDLRFKSLIE